MTLILLGQFAARKYQDYQEAGQKHIADYYKHIGLLYNTPDPEYAETVRYYYSLSQSRESKYLHAFLKACNVPDPSFVVPGEYIVVLNRTKWYYGDRYYIFNSKCTWKMVISLS